MEIRIRLTAERKAGIYAQPGFSIALDAPALRLHVVVADIMSPYACRSALGGAADRILSVTCTPRFEVPVATVVLDAQRIEVHRLGDKGAEETLGFDLPPGSIARGEERELVATELEGRACARAATAREVDLRASARPGLERATGIYLEGSALRERLKMCDLWGEFGCSFKVDEHQPDWSLLQCRREGQTDYLWVRAEPGSLLLISKVHYGSSGPMPIPADLTELARDRTAQVGRISLACGAHVRVRETELIEPSAASLGHLR